MNDSYKGFSLFNDIEDKELQTRNRAIIMANIAEQYTVKKKINIKGASLIVGYFDNIPKTDRKLVEEKFTSVMQERNYVLS